MAETVKDKVAAAMDAFQLSLAGIPDERVDEPGVCGEWSVKDLVHHVAYWENNEAEELEAVLHGEGRPPHPDGEWWLAVNDAVAPTWKGRSYQDARRELTDAHRRLFNALDGFPADEAPAKVDEDTWRHLDEHRAQIEAWRTAQGLG